MTNLQQIASGIHDDLANMDAHQARIKPLWDAAFQGPIITEYKPGDIVWLLDHYNTGRITEVVHYRGDETTYYHVDTTDADGSVLYLVYEPGWLRPATEECVFVWPESADTHEAGCDRSSIGAPVWSNLGYSEDE